MVTFVLPGPAASSDPLGSRAVDTQDTLANVFGRAVRLDCLCTLGNGSRCNIEVQRSDNDNHFKRVRVNEAGITWKE